MFIFSIWIQSYDNFEFNLIPWIRLNFTIEINLSNYLLTHNINVVEHEGEIGGDINKMGEIWDELKLGI